VQSLIVVEEEEVEVEVNDDREYRDLREVLATAILNWKKMPTLVLKSFETENW